MGASKYIFTDRMILVLLMICLVSVFVSGRVLDNMVIENFSFFLFYLCASFFLAFWLSRGELNRKQSDLILLAIMVITLTVNVLLSVAHKVDVCEKLGVVLYNDMRVDKRYFDEVMHPENDSAALAGAIFRKYGVSVYYKDSNGVVKQFDPREIDLEERKRQEEFQHEAFSRFKELKSEINRLLFVLLGGVLYLSLATPLKIWIIRKIRP